MKVSFDLLKYKIIPNITDPFDLLELSHTCKSLRNAIHFMERKCPNPDCEQLYCQSGSFKTFLYLLNVIAGIDPIKQRNWYHPCIVYQIRFILFPYKKRFSLSYKSQLVEYHSPMHRYYPTVGIDSDGRYTLFYFYWIMDRGTPNWDSETKFKIDTFEPLELMHRMAELYCGNYKDEYYKVLIVSGVWKTETEITERIKLDKLTIYLTFFPTKYLIQTFTTNVSCFSSAIVAHMFVNFKKI
jgi:hypothetical protein